MNPVAFQVGGTAIHWYGVCLAAAFVAVVTVWNLLGGREGRPPAFGSLLGLVVITSGLLGARLAYCLTAPGMWPQFWNLREGGLVYLGGFVAGTAALLVFAAARHESPLGLADFGVTAVPLGHAIGRIGCFLNGCCYGRPAAVLWCIQSHDACRHPVQLYEAAAELVLFAVLLRAYDRRQHRGFVLGLYAVLYGIWRFFIEFLRGDPRPSWLGLSSAQWTSLALVAAGVWLTRPRSEIRKPLPARGTDGTS